MIPVPNTKSPFVDQARKIISPWIQYLQQFTQAPPSFLNVDIGASPFEYTASEPGFIYILGGTITSVALIRGSDFINLTGQVLVPVSINDIVRIVYSVIPISLTFVPSFGQRTG